MKQGYTIRIESDNPEFDLGEKLREGLQVDGFLLLTVRDGEPFSECLQKMTIMELARFFNLDEESGSLLCQASAIGEGLRRAEQLRTEFERRSSNRKLAKIVAEKMRKDFDDLK